MKKLAILLSLLLIPGIMFGAGKQSDKGYIENLSEEEILKGEGCSKGSSFQKTSNNKTTIKVKSFSGFEEVLVLSPKNQNVEVTISSTVESGAMRIFICDKDSIVHEFAADEKNQTFRLPSTNGKYVLKLAGKNARYTLEIEATAKKTELPSFEGMIL